MTSSFNPPSSTGKPHVPTWVPPPATTADVDFAQLRTVDLALLDSPDPREVQELVATAKSAIREDGFLFLVNYGVSFEQASEAKTQEPDLQLMRQFSLAQYMFDNISQEDKERLLWDPKSGMFPGYKPDHGWSKTALDKPDGIEHFNFYCNEFIDPSKQPECIKPFMDEIAAFCNYLSDSVNRRLLKLLSKVLELPDDWLYDNIQSRSDLRGDCVGEGYYRHAVFHPLRNDTREASGGMRMRGHTDYGTTTMLFSVPISCLQIWCPDEQWRYVSYKPGALVINIGEVLEIVSGGHFKATRHRVFEAPPDQRDSERLSIVLFQYARGDLKLQPAQESKLIQREGCVEDQVLYAGFKRIMDAGAPIPSNKQWREAQISIPRPITESLDSVGKTLEVNGKLMTEREFFGVKVLLPV